MSIRWPRYLLKTIRRPTIGYFAVIIARLYVLHQVVYPEHDVSVHSTDMSKGGAAAKHTDRMNAKSQKNTSC